MQYPRFIRAACAVVALTTVGSPALACPFQAPADHWVGRIPYDPTKGGRDPEHSADWENGNYIPTMLEFTSIQQLFANVPWAQDLYKAAGAAVESAKVADNVPPAECIAEYKPQWDLYTRTEMDTECERKIAVWWAKQRAYDCRALSRFRWEWQAEWSERGGYKLHHGKTAYWFQAIEYLYQKIAFARNEALILRAKAWRIPLD